MRTLGVDVSHWEGSIDWQVAAPSIGFAYYKCTDGIRFVDDQFANNQQGCSQAGIAHAPYHYFQPSLDPLAQAEFFVHTAGKGYQRYILDVEAPERVEDITQKLRVCLKQVEQLTATRPTIYTSAGYWNDFIQPKPDWTDEYDLIVAHYTLAHQPMLPIGWTNWRIWQFSDYWNIPGCNEEVDANWFNGRVDECQKWFGNSTDPEAHQPQERITKLSSLFDGLHIRQSPNVQARISGKLARGEVVEVEELGGHDVWVRHTRGWSCVERNSYRYMEVVK